MQGSQSRLNPEPIWSPETIAAILREAPQPYCALFYWVALNGVRQGDLLGLQWKHINLTARKLRIEQSLWQGQLVAPKTVGSLRTICLGSVLTEVLAAHFQQTAHKAPEDFVFCTKEGSPLHPDVVRKDVL